MPTGGPAYASGQIEIGDDLVAVNDHNVEELDPRGIAPYILGPPGTKVKMDFCTKGGKMKSVVLQRGYTMPENGSVATSAPTHAAATTAEKQ